jgi:hypothetical protein
MKLQTKSLCILVVLVLAVMAAVPAGADTGKPSVAVSDITVSPAAFMPGDTGTITITLTNPARSLSGSSTTSSDSYSYGPGLSDAGAGGSHTTSTSTTSSTAPDGAIMLNDVMLIADSPVHVTSAVEFRDVGRLGMGDTARFTFKVKVDDNAADTTYFLKFQVRTNDDSVYLNYPVSLTVDSAPLKVVLNDAPSSFSTTKSSVILDIFNVRPDGVQGVGVVPIGDDFTFKPMQEYVVGNIGSGEMYTVQFDVSAKNLSYSGDPSFKVVYQNGENWHESVPLIVPSSHNKAAAAAPTTGDNNTLLAVLAVLLVAIIVIGGAFVYLGGRNKKH